MKYLFDRRDFREALKQLKCLDLWFFFNERGSEIQMTFEGLLRTILFELAGKRPFLLTIVFNVYVQDVSKAESQWSITSLHTAFDAVLVQTHEPLNLVLFLDALDEYKGLPEMIATWIKDLTNENRSSRSLTKVKICFSSRAWDTFIRDFDTDPGFVLHEYTQSDIRQYAAAQIRSICAVNGAQTHHTEDLYWNQVPAYQIVDLLAGLAEGVFLWIRLAIDDLKQQPFDSLETLEKLLKALPQSLEEFYARIVQRIPSDSRDRALVLLETVYRSPTILSLDEIHLAAECALEDTYGGCARRFEQHRIRESSVNDRKSSLLNFCAGFLESVAGPEPEH